MTAQPEQAAASPAAHPAVRLPHLHSHPMHFRPRTFRAVQTCALLHSRKHWLL